MTPALIVAVAAGGAVGALARYLVTAAMASRAHPPVAVTLVNVVGSLISGVAMGAISDPALLAVVVVGFCGALTTFSTLTVETVQLLVDGRARRAVSGMLVSVIAGTVAVAIGTALGSALAPAIGTIG